MLTEKQLPNQIPTQTIGYSWFLPQSLATISKTIFFYAPLHYLQISPLHSIMNLNAVESWRSDLAAKMSVKASKMYSWMLYAARNHMFNFCQMKSNFTCKNIYHRETMGFQFIGKYIKIVQWKGFCMCVWICEIFK